MNESERIFQQRYGYNRYFPSDDLEARNKCKIQTPIVEAERWIREFAEKRGLTIFKYLRLIIESQISRAQTDTFPIYKKTVEYLYELEKKDRD